VRDARVIKDTFGGGGFTGIDVRHDADIPELAEILLSHCFIGLWFLVLVL
jgi:hypothetical protein